VAGNAAGEAELLKQPFHTFLVLANIWIHLAVGAFEKSLGNQRRAAVPGTDDVDHI
jgi:hypothetical protein